MLINKRLLSYTKEARKYIIAKMMIDLIKLIMTIIYVSALSLLIHTLMRKGYSQKALIHFVTIFSTAVIIKTLVTLLQGRINAELSSSIRVKMRDMLFDKLKKIEMRYKTVSTTSTLVTNAIEGIESLQVYYERYIPQLFYCLLAPVILFGFISKLYFPSALVLIILLPLIPLSIILLMKHAKKQTKSFWKNYESLGHYFLESLKGLTTLILFKQDKHRGKQLHNKSWAFRNATMRLLQTQLGSIVIMDTIAYAGAFFAFALALLAFKEKTIELYTTINILLLSIEFFIPVRTLGSYFHAGMNGVAAANHIFRILDIPDENIDSVLQKAINPDNKMIFKNVSFSYEKKTDILKNISFSVPPQSSFAIVGRSGSGKSTIASLILKLYPVKRGKIKIGGININDISKDEIRKHIALITHDSYIFSGTLRDNLLMGKPNATDKQMYDALKEANLYNFVNKSEHSLNSQVGEGGSKLSGGERQRLAIARAILQDASIYIFDEATSHVDIASESKIWNAIYRIAEKKTTIIISHRLATVENANTIAVLRDKHIVESGTHAALMAQKGEYFSLAYEQAKIEKAGRKNA